jgi:SAM-dependent methyltransferase
MSELTRLLHGQLIADGQMSDQSGAQPTPFGHSGRRALSIPLEQQAQQLKPPATNGPRSRPRRRIKTLNLIYHLWPVSANDLWTWNLEQLLQRLDIFTGRRVMAIATDTETVTAGKVKAFIEDRSPGHGIEFIDFANEPKMREAHSFIRLLEAVKTSDPSEATFYAHAKGVSRGPSIHPVEKAWAECMYHHCLDFPERVMDAIGRRGMYGVSFQCERRWIFPGTFWWFHNASLFAKPGWDTLRNPMTTEGLGWSVEAFPNRFFADDCERVYPDIKYPPDRSLGLYDPRLWNTEGCNREFTLGERARWRWENHGERASLTWGRSLSGAPILATVGRYAKLKGTRVLEVGPGYGRFLEAAEKKRVNITYSAIDLSMQRTRELRRRWPDKTWVCGNIESLRDVEPLGTFDLIVGTLVFHRLCPNFQLAATVCRSLLAPGGHLMFDVPEVGAREATPEEVAIGSFESNCGGFTKSYRRDEIASLLDRAGFTDVRFDSLAHDAEHVGLFVIARKA